MQQILFRCCQACPINTSQQCSAGAAGWLCHEDVTWGDTVCKPFAVLCFGRAWVCCRWGCAYPVTWAKKEGQQHKKKNFCFLRW